MAFYFRKKYNRQDKTFPEIRIYELASLPIKQIDKQNETLQNEISKYVNQLMKLNEEKAVTKLQSTMSQIDNRIKYCDDKINDFVNKLYELSEDEIDNVNENLI